MSIAELLLSNAPEEVTWEFRAIDGFEQLLAALVRRGASSWPDIAVDETAWAEHLARHLAPGNVAEQLTSMHASGVHLALGCLAGSARAYSEFDAKLREIAPRALSRLRLSRTACDELLQDARERLLLAKNPDSRPKLATYSGRGPLEGWLRVTLARAAISSLRKGADAERDLEQTALEQVALDDPQLEALRQRCAPALARAIEDAIAALPDADRVLMRLHLVDGLTIDDLAVVYKAHRATTARRLARVRNQIFRSARERAMAGLRVNESEFASIMGLMLSQLDITFVRLLQGGDRQPEPLVSAADARGAPGGRTPL